MLNHKPSKRSQGKNKTNEGGKDKNKREHRDKGLKATENTT